MINDSSGFQPLGTIISSLSFLGSPAEEASTSQIEAFLLSHPLTNSILTLLIIHDICQHSLYCDDDDDDDDDLY